MSQITTQDLETYAHCAQYYALAKKHRHFPYNPDHERTVSIGKALYAMKLRTGEWPTFKDLDRIANKVNADNDGELLGVFVYFMHKYMKDHEPVHIDLTHTIRTQYVQLEAQVPVVATGPNGLQAVFFKNYPLKDQYINTDWQIVIMMNWLYEHLGVQEAAIYNLTPPSGNIRTIPHSMRKVVLAETLYKEPERLSVAVASLMNSTEFGPFHPILKCTKTQCPYYGGECGIGNV